MSNRSIPAVRRPTPRAALVGIVVAVAAGGGCKDSLPDRVPVHPLSATVTYQGKPAAGAKVTLLPTANLTPDSLKPNGVVNDKGKVEFQTYSGSPGVPAGEYFVLLRWEGPRGGGEAGDGPSMLDTNRDFFRNKYGDPKTTPFRATVGPDTAELKPIELK